MLPSNNSDIAGIVRAALDVTERLVPADIMVVGARCRDILHVEFGHTFRTAATQDLDLALAMSSWDGYRDLQAAFDKVGDTGIRFRIAGTDVDLLPFGGIERPEGFVEPPGRGEKLSVWAFEEIFASSGPLALTETLSIQKPTAAGYAAAKLGAWLDRSAWYEAKDAGDLALVMYWYAESTAINDRLYDTPTGIDILVAEQADVPLAAAHLLGVDVATTIGTARIAELRARWPGNVDLLVRDLRLQGRAWQPTQERRAELIDALTRGLFG